MKHVKTEQELGEALKENADRIEIEGDLSKKVFRIRATGKVAWAVCIGCIAIGIAAVVMSGPPGLAVIAPAAGVLGISTAVSAIMIGVAAGGVAALTRLRDYKEVFRSHDSLVLEKRK